MNVKLVVVQGKPEGKEIPLKGTRFLIGRGPECQLRPNSELISRQHSLFTVNGEKVTVRDMGSTNGTLVNGNRIEGEVTLGNGDLVQVGPLGFKVVLDAAPAEAQPPASQPEVAAAPPVPPAAAPVPPSPTPTPAPVAPPLATARLGSKSAEELDIAEWLLADSTHPVPKSGSEVYSGDTQTLQIGPLGPGGSPSGETTADAPPASPEPPEGDRVVEGEGGIRIKLSAAKQKIEKTREDTSKAAADILRRMMNRRPGPSK